MKQTILLLSILVSLSAKAQVQVLSGVFNWKNSPIIKEATRDRRQLVDGTTVDLSSLEIHTSTLEPGKAPHPSHTHTDEEELIIVKEGKLKATIKDKSTILGPGSIAVAIPGEEHGFENGGNTNTTYYILKFKSKTAHKASNLRTPMSLIFPVSKLDKVLRLTVTASLTCVCVSPCALRAFLMD